MFSVRRHLSILCVLYNIYSSTKHYTSLIYHLTLKQRNKTSRSQYFVFFVPLWFKITIKHKPIPTHHHITQKRTTSKTGSPFALSIKRIRRLVQLSFKFFNFLQALHTSLVRFINFLTTNKKSIVLS